MWLALYFGKGESTIIAENYGKRRNAVSKPCEQEGDIKLGRKQFIKEKKKKKKSSKGPTRF